MFVSNRYEFVVLRGASPDRLTDLAREITALLPGKSARIPLDAFRSGWVTQNGLYEEADMELSYRIGKLVAVSYIRGGYHIVMEDATTGDLDQGEMLNELISLIRTLPVHTRIINCVLSDIVDAADIVLCDERIDLAAPPATSARGIVERMHAQRS